jgi:predicted DCC family thiol-disulfide oxidoreductase YuxK
MNIVLFDGECNFCNASVKVIIKYDKEDRIKFASQQSDIGKKMMLENRYFNNPLDTIIFISANKIYTKTDAIIEICKLLKGFPKVILIIGLIPKKIRDYLYSLFSKYRYNLFGKRSECLIPTSEIRSKFIE